MQNPVVNRLIGDIGDGKDAGDIAAVRRIHQSHHNLHVPARRLSRNLDEALHTLLKIFSPKRGKRRLIQIDPIEFASLFLIHYQSAHSGKELLPHASKQF